MHANFSLIYIIFAMMFAGLVLNALPHYQKTKLKAPSIYWLMALIFAAVGCFAYSLLTPHWRMARKLPTAGKLLRNTIQMVMV
jgi:hypothetical protein